MPNDIFQKVAIHCNNCDEDFFASLVFLRKSPKCPICTKRKEKATLQKRIDDFIDDLNTRTEGRISYVSSTTQFAMVKLHCNLCNHIWDMPLTEARKNDACPICNPERFISHVDAIKEKIGNRSKGLIECLEFTEKQIPVKLRCTCCGKEWETTYKEAHEIPICPFCVKEKDKNSITVMDINPLNNDALCDLKVQLLGTHLYQELRDKTQYKRPELVIELLMHIGYLSAPIEIKDIARFDRRPFKDIESFLRNFENTYYNFIHNVTVNGYVSKAYEEATKANKIRIREKRD
jgi:hypothetical protein